MKNLIKRIKMKYFSTITLIKQRDRLKEELQQSHRFVPPGHFYSPIPSVDEIKQNVEKNGRG